jgi:hypothetical protein
MGDASVRNLHSIGSEQLPFTCGQSATISSTAMLDHKSLYAAQ